MHEAAKHELEKHLPGEGRGQKASPAFYAHLDSCADCREEVNEMDEISRIMRDLAPSLDGVPQPSLGFYSRVASTIREQQPRSPLAHFFSPGLVFFRRVAFASVLLLTGLGTLLINEVSEDGSDATAIMAQYDTNTAHAPAAEPDNLLVTLAAYHD